MKQFKLIPTDDWFDYDIKITLKPCFRCNQKCWYCVEYDNKTSTWSESDCETVLDKLSTLPERYKNIFFYFYGGEPTLSKYWETLQYSIVKMFPERRLFVQTQTNMSVKLQRLQKFLETINQVKSDSHTIDICSSYHLGMQRVEDFIEKMELCDRHDALGLCFFSTEIIKEKQCIDEFRKIRKRFPNKLKMRFTLVTQEMIRDRKEYQHIQTDHLEFIHGNDGGKLEQSFFTEKYPEVEEHLEQGWNFSVDDSSVNYSYVMSKNINKQFKHMKCKCGTMGMVIDHNLKVYHCNDDYYKQINFIDIEELQIDEFLRKDVRCLQLACYDGLDYTKYK